MSTPSDQKRPPAQQSTLFELPDDPPPPSPTQAAAGRPRLRTANREQIVFRAAPLDALLPPDHPARIVWDYVVGLDLGPWLRQVKAVEGGPGRAPIDPKILMALWLYATIEGIGSARELDRLCREQDAFRWIAGDVTTNYHTLADFRTDHVELLDDLLTKSVAALMTEGLIDLNRVAQEGMRVRASAGAASFRRRPTLEEALAQRAFKNNFSIP
jgi:transposase